MSEVACEFPEPQTCNYDQPSFKAYLSRWMAVASQLAPFAAADIRPRLKASAIAAAAQCAGQQKNMCGRRWYQDHWDGFFGVGEQMSALSVFQNNLIDTAKAPFTAKTGGNSKSDPGAGTGDDAELILDPALRAPITTADRAGAGILTFISIVMVLSGSGWMIL